MAKNVAKRAPLGPMKKHLDLRSKCLACPRKPGALEVSMTY
jgi:hypothetical protein